MDNNQLRVNQQQVQNMHIKIELLDSKDNVLETIEGFVTSGNISISATSLIRRTCDIDMIITSNNYIPSSGSKIWIDKKFKLYVGIDDNRTKEIIWFNKGIYYFDNPSLSYSEGERTISFTGLDKMTFFDTQLEYITRIDSGVPLFDAIKSTLTIIGETKYIISDVDTLYIPYEIEKDETSTIEDILVEIRDLYMGFEMFYDENGYFIFQKIKDRKYDIVDYVFDNSDKMAISYTNAPEFSNVKNHIIIYGTIFDDGTQIKAELKNQNDNCFGIDSIGRRPMVVSDDKVQNSSQAIMRAEYELWLHSHLNEKISINSIQILGLDVNRIITVNNSAVGINGNYIIESINHDLEGTMNLNCNKLYY